MTRASYPTAGDAWLALWPAIKADGAGDKEAAGVVVTCLDRLYRQRRIDLSHARILRIWGERSRCPDHREPKERGDHRIWCEAMAELEMPLRIRGVVA